MNGELHAVMTISIVLTVSRHRYNLQVNAVKCIYTKLYFYLYLLFLGIFDLHCAEFLQTCG